MKIAAALAVLKHLLVVTKIRHLRDSPHFPFADWRLGLSGTDRHRIGGYDLIAFKHAKHVGFRVDLDRNGRLRSFVFLCLCVLVRIFGLRVWLFFDLVDRLRGDFAAGLDFLYRSEVEWFDIRHQDLVAGLERLRFAGIELFEQMNITVEFLGDGFGRAAIGKVF